MKTIKLLFCASLLVLSSSLSFGQSWMWGQHGYGDLNVDASSVATDKTGNAYMAGYYFKTIIFGSDTLNNKSQNAYLTKYDPSGNLVWAKQIIDTAGISYGVSVATDNFGNVYLTGEFYGNAKAGAFSLTDTISKKDTNLFQCNVFLIKYNAAGTVLWAKQSQAPTIYSYASPNSIATDKNGNIFITGGFTDTVTFGSSTLRNIYNNRKFDYTNVFLVKYDSAGNVLWAKQSDIPSEQNSGFGWAVAADINGNAYITGYLRDTIYFGANKLTAFFNHNTGFIVKYSPGGNVLWAKQSITGFTNGSANCVPYSVITDKSSNVYFTGIFCDSVLFGSNQLYASTSSGFFTKYDSAGNEVWAQKSSPGFEGNALAADAFNHIYLAGGTSYYSLDTLKFGSLSLFTTPWTGYNSFILRFDTAGKAICGSVLNTIGGEANALACDSSGTYFYICGTVDNTLICGSDTLLDIPNTSYNAYLARWQNCDPAGIGPIATLNPSVTLFPNPNGGVFTLQIVEAQNFMPSTIEIYNVLGERVITEILPPSTRGQYDNLINLSEQPNGIYLYRVLSDDGKVIGEGKVIIAK